MITIASWNMARKMHRKSDWSSLNALCDIALLQECVPPHPLPENTVFSIATGRTKAFGTALSSQYDLSEKRVVDGSEGRAVAARIPGLSNVTCVSVHNVPVSEKGGNYPKAALNIMEAIAKNIDLRQAAPIVIGGDWNSSVHFDWKNFVPVFERFNDLGLMDVTCVNAGCTHGVLCRNAHEPTFFRGNDGFRIDYLYVNAAASSRLRSVSVASERLGSDHAPIIAEFDF